MTRLPEPLAKWALEITSLDWAGYILDADWTLRWISDELKEFLGSDDDEELGVGLHLGQAFLKEAWFESATPESRIEMARKLGPFVLNDFARSGRAIDELPLPEPLRVLFDDLEPESPQEVVAWSFHYVRRTGPDELPPYRVNTCAFKMTDETGTLLGYIVLTFMGVRPNLLALLARGDEQMYERMARLVEPSPHRAGILFCDMHESGVISRRLPSAGYFKLVRRLWTGIDDVIATETGIVGKHAGDGASAYFLVDDLETESAAAAAAIRAARRIHEVSAAVFREVVDTECLMKVGVHWGGNVYMGQLVPGGRLDVTALGDEVNEAARVQESIGPGETLVSKALLDQLSPEDASSLGIDVEKLRFQTLAELPTAPEKAKRDAGGLSVVVIG